MLHHVASEDPAQQVKVILRKLRGIPVSKQAESCKAWLQSFARVSFRAKNHSELTTLLDVYASAIAAGRVKESNLHIAAEVIAGKLDGDIVVSSLLTKFLAFQD